MGLLIIFLGVLMAYLINRYDNRYFILILVPIYILAKIIFLDFAINLIIKSKGLNSSSGIEKDDKDNNDEKE